MESNNNRTNNLSTSEPVKNSGRRDFFKSVFFYTGAGILVNILARGTTYAADALQLIDMSQTKRKDPTNAECVKAAKGINYVDNLEKALKDKKITKSDMPGAGGKVWKVKEQTCDTCALYDYKHDGQATCQIIPNCLVSKKGSCVAWAPKAK